MVYLQASLASDETPTIKCQSYCPKLQDQDGWLNLDELGRNFLFSLGFKSRPLSLSISLSLSLSLPPLMFVCSKTYGQLVFIWCNISQDPQEIFSPQPITQKFEFYSLALTPSLSFSYTLAHVYEKLSINSIDYILNLV